MKCYKVLYRDWKDRLLSIGEAFGHPKELIIEYTPGEMVFAPKETWLFVFDTWCHAALFASKIHSNYDDNVEIWEVDARQTTRRIERVAYISVYKALARLHSKTLRGAIRDFWYSALCNEFMRDNTVSAPIGTLACDLVILRRRVDDPKKKMYHIDRR